MVMSISWNMYYISKKLKKNIILYVNVLHCFLKLLKISQAFQDIHATLQKLFFQKKQLPNGPKEKQLLFPEITLPTIEI